MLKEIIKNHVRKLKQTGLFRELKNCKYVSGRKMLVNGKEIIDFASNDYLGLKNHPDIIAASSDALLKYGTGSGASRLISGNHPLYHKLETVTAKYKKYPCALVFGSGYMLNTSVIPALAGEGDAVILDRLNHASLIDGARLSGAKFMVYQHSDMNDLEDKLKRAGKYKKRLIISDTVFSMDGDIAPLRHICDLSQKYSCFVLLDEAHATGVIGPKGRGVTDQEGLSQNFEFVMGTFSKALGSLGAFLCTQKENREYLINTARGLIFTTALPPAVLAASIRAIGIAEKASARRKRLFKHVRKIRESLEKLGFDTGKGRTQIIPVILKDEKYTVAFAEKLRKNGLFIPAVRYPAVKRNQARLRISVSSEHADEDVMVLINAFRKVS